jgi:hypothetical protein
MEARMGRMAKSYILAMNGKYKIVGRKVDSW